MNHLISRAAAALLLLSVVGCSGFWERKTLPGPDGTVGTDDDVLVESGAEAISEWAQTLSEMFGNGWIGMLIQAFALVVGAFALREAGKKK